MENVAALLRRGFDVVEANLATIGYNTRWLCLRAPDMGAAHRRDRLFLLYLDTWSTLGAPHNCRVPCQAVMARVRLYSSRVIA
ncbi:DNA cytosine methyltransferase [Micromonospora sp. NPDC005205]|uniref:DNA cytosine methyltransferase n=1 Tax=Micromonospora sp. NPDC005205 TaxID=3156714 RepID=UPI0033B4B8F6